MVGKPPEVVCLSYQDVWEQIDGKRKWWDDILEQRVVAYLVHVYLCIVTLATLLLIYTVTFEALRGQQVKHSDEK